MLLFSSKPGDQTNKRESTNVVNKTGLAKRWAPLPKLSYFYETSLTLTDTIVL